MNMTQRKALRKTLQPNKHYHETARKKRWMAMYGELLRTVTMQSGFGVSKLENLNGN